jgi:hypothetical protein
VQDPEPVRLARTTLDALTPDTDPAVACEVLIECRYALFDYAPPAELRRMLIEDNPSGMGPWSQLSLDTVLDLWDGDLADAEARILGPQKAMLDEEFEDVSDSIQQTWMGQLSEKLTDPPSCWVFLRPCRVPVRSGRSGGTSRSPFARPRPGVRD